MNFNRCVADATTNGRGLKVGLGPQDPGPQDPGTREPPQSLRVGPGTPLKFKSGTPGPSSKFKSGTPGPPSTDPRTLIIIFLRCLTYFVIDKYMYDMEKSFPRIVGILSYILCFEPIHYFREIFNVTLGVPNLVADREIHATCLASNLPENSLN